MDPASSHAPGRAPICGCLAALFRLLSLSVALVPAFRPSTADAGQQLGRASIPFLILDFIPLAAVCLAVAAILRHERFRWLGWAVLFSFALPILVALIVGIDAAFRY